MAKKLVFLIALAIFVAQGVEVVPSCTINDQLNGVYLYTEVGETNRISLNGLLNGMNVSYSLNDQADNDSISIQQKAQYITGESFNTDIVIGVSYRFETNGTGFFSVLSQTDTFFDVHFGQGDHNFAPHFSKQVGLNTDKFTQCFDLTEVLDGISVVDCRQNYKGQQTPFKDVFYIVNENDITSAPYQEFNTYYAEGDILDRKIVSYTSDRGDIFVVSGIVFDHLVKDTTRNETYINVFRYDPTNTSGDFKYGQLIAPSEPITSQSFGLQNFFIADYEVIDDRIYVLDHTQGIYSFVYAANKVTDIVHINLQSLGITEAWGMSLSYDGAIIQLDIVDQNSVHQFYMLDHYSPPQVYTTYPIGTPVYSTASIKSNTEYIVLQHQMLVYVYERGNSDPTQLHAIFQGVHQSQLLFQNTLYLYNTTFIAGYQLSDPVLLITMKQNVDDATRTIVATSTYSFDSVVCSFTFSSKKVDAGATGLFYTNIDANNTYQYITRYDQPSRALILDEQFSGPNVYYKFFIGEDDANDTTVIVDQPLNVHNLTVPGADPANWIFSTQIQFGDHVYWTIHQHMNMSLMLYQCYINEYDIYSIMCENPIIVNLTSAILDVAYGYFGDLIPVLAIVETGTPSKVVFYDLKSGNQLYSFQYPDFTMRAITLFNLQLIITTQANEIYIYDRQNGYKLYAKIDTDYVKSWIDVIDDWNPKYVLTNTNYDNILFVVSNNTRVFLIDIARFPLYLSQVAITNKGPTVKCRPMLGQKSLLLVYSDNSVDEYNLDNLASQTLNIKIASYHTYERYNFFNPTTASISCNGLLYVLANDTDANSGTGGVVVLVYRTFSSMIRTLYAAVDLGEPTLNYIGQIQASTYGYDMGLDIVYVQVNNKFFYLRVPLFPSVIVYPVLPSYYYSEAVPFKVQASSKLNATATKLLQEQITVVNTQQYVTVNPQAIGQSGIQNLLVTQNVSYENPQVFEFDSSSWFDGPVIGLIVHCDDCDQNKISLQNRVQEIPIGLGFLPGVIDSVYSQHTGKAYFLKENSVYMYTMPGYTDYGPQIQLNFTHEFGDQVICEKLIRGEDANYTVLEYLFALCYDPQMNAYVIAPVHMQDGDYTALAALSLNIISKLGEVQYKDGFLLVQNLQNDPKGQSSILVYDLYNDIKSGKSQATKLREFNSKYPDVGSPLNISSFQVYSTDHQEARVLFFMNYTTTFYYAILSTKDYSILRYTPGDQSWDHINMYQNLKSLNAYILPETSFRTIRVASFKIDNLGSNEVALEYNIIVSTSNTASYYVMIALQSTTATEHKTILDYEIQYAFQNYGNNYVLDRIEAFEDFFGIAYWNTVDSKITVCVYNRDNSPAKRDKASRSIPMRQMVGGYEYVYSGVGKVPTPAFMFVPGSGAGVELYVNNPGPMQSSHHFQLNPKNISIIVSTTDFQAQQMTFYAVSDFAIYLHQFRGTIDYLAPIPPIPGDFKPFCQVNEELNGLNLITEVGEISRWPLMNFIQGFNLTYSLNETATTEILSVSQPSQIKYNTSFLSDLILGSSFYTEDTGNTVISILTQSNGYYDTWWGQADKKSLNFTVNVMLNVDVNTTCYGLTEVMDGISVVDCRVNDTSYDDGFYVMNVSNPRAPIIQLYHHRPIEGAIYSRKTITVVDGGLTYVVSGCTFPQIKNQFSWGQTFLNVYLYKNDEPSLPNGYLEYSFTIDASTFNLGELQIADFQVLGGRMWVLDHVQGIFTFRLANNTISDYHVHYLKEFGLEDAWGMALGYDHGEMELHIVGSGHLFTFVIEGYNVDLKRTIIYKLEAALVGIPVEITANTNYMTVLGEKYLFVYQKGNPNSNDIVAVYKDIHIAQLLYTNTLLTYNTGNVTAYTLEFATLKVTQKADSINEKRVLKAVSYYLDEPPVECTISLNTVKINAGATGVFATGLTSNGSSQVITRYNGPSKAVLLDEDYFGPDLEFKFQLGDEQENDNKFLGQKQTQLGDSEYQFDVPLAIHEPNVPEANPKDWNFGAQIQFSNHSFKTVHQNTQNNDIIIYDCDIEVTSIDTINCQEPKIIPSNSSLVKVTYGHFGHNSGSLAIVTYDQQQIVRFYDIFEYGFQNQLYLDANITFFHLSENILFVITYTKEIRLYMNSSSSGLNQVTSLKFDYVKNWPGIDNNASNWNPKEILTQKLQDDVFFILNGKNMVYVVDYSQGKCVLENNIQIDLQEDFDAFVGLFSLLVVHKETNTVSEYDLQDLDSATIDEKIASYNNYNRFTYFGIISPTITQNGMLCILANDIISNSIVLLVYRTYSPLVRSLYASIDLNQNTVDTNKYMTVSASSVGWQTDADYVYVQFNDKMWYVRIPYQPSVLINPVLPIHYYTEQINLKYTILSRLNETVGLNQQRQVIVANLQNYVSINIDAITASGIQNIELYSNSNEVQQFTYNTEDWFTGPVLGFTAHCPDCDTKINLKNRINEIKIGYDFLQNVQDGFYNSHSGLLYYLIADQIHQHQMPNYEPSGLPIDFFFGFYLPDNIDCFQLVEGQNTDYSELEYIFGICYDQTRTQWIVAPVYFQDGNASNPQSMLAVAIEEVENPGTIQYKDGFLLVQNVQTNETAQSSVKVYSIVQDIKDKKQVGTKVYEYGTGYPNVGANLNITSFQVWDTNHDEARILLFTNYTNYLYYVIVNSKDYSMLKDDEGGQSWDHMNLQLNIQNKGGYITPETRFYSMKENEGEYDVLIYKFLVQTSNTAPYSCALYLNSSGKDEHKTVLQTDIEYAFQNYGDNYPLNRIEVQPHGSYVAMSYWNLNKNTISIAVYKPTAKPSIPAQNIGGVPTIPMQFILGGYEYEYQSQGIRPVPQPVFFFVPLTILGGKLELYSNDVSGGRTNSHHFQVNNYELTVQYIPDPDDPISNQDIVFYAQSDFAVYLDQFRSKLTTENKPNLNPSDKKDGLSSWVIVIIVIAGVLVLGAVGFFIYKKKQRQTQEMQDAEQGLSLQEPLKA